MRPSTSREKVRELAATGKYETMTAIAAAVGISRERVRQLIRQYDIPWQDYGARLEWECPGCGNWISVQRSTWENTWNHMPAHCRACHLEDRSRFCKRGHLREKYRNAQGACRACLRLRGMCIAEVRVCKACGGPLSISRGVRNQIKYGHCAGNYHRSCWTRKLGSPISSWWAEASLEQRAQHAEKVREGVRWRWAGLTTEQRAASRVRLATGYARWWAGLNAEQRAAPGDRVQAGRRAGRERRHQ